MNRLPSLADLILPSKWAGLFVMAAAAGAILGLPAGAFLAWGESRGLADFIATFAFVYGFWILPAVAAMLAMGAAIEKESLPRGLIWAAAMAAAAAGGSVGGLGYLLTREAEFLPRLIPLWVAAAALLVPAGIHLARAWPGLLADVQRVREDRVLQMIEARGEISLADLARETGLRPAATAAAVDKLSRTGRLAGYLDAARGRVYSFAALRAKQRHLAAVVAARGQITLPALSAELQAPRELLRQWIYALVERQEFSGYVNWDEETLYSAEARQLSAAGHCPQCGGELALAGKGVIRCGHCGSEIFI